MLHIKKVNFVNIGDYYEKALNNMVVENGISGSIKSWADEVANYGNTNKYFKIINGGDCRF